MYRHGGYGGDPDTTNKISFSLPIAVPYEIRFWLALWFLNRRRLKSFAYVNQVTPGAVPFNPRATILAILVDVLKIKLHTKYQRPGLYSFRQEDFSSFAYRSLCKNTWPFSKKVKVNLRYWRFGSGEVDF